MKAYISCPLGVAWTCVEDTKKKLVKLGYEVTYFTRGDCYQDFDLREADIFVLIPENNQFDFFQKNMTAGCKKELDVAADMQKPLYLAYYKGDKTLNIYPISDRQLMDGRVIGLSGRYIQPVSQITNLFPIY